jgi:hypothetical protein
MVRAPAEALSVSTLQNVPFHTKVNPMSRLQRREDFGPMLLDCVDATFSNLFGSKVKDAAYLVLERSYFPRSEIPLKPERFGSFLEDVFGVAGLTIGRAIARCLYTKLGLSYTDEQTQVPRLHPRS